MSHRVTMVCDLCGNEYIVDEVMDMPPYWFAVTVAVADKEGFVPDQEKDEYLHFCSQECLSEFMSGQDITDLRLLVDKPSSQENRDSEPPEERAGEFE